jgi:hypothetical protein
MGRRHFFASVGTFLAAMLLAAPAAQASFHEIKVREVYPGANNDSYVELQMYSAGQNFVVGHSLTLYDSAGALAHTSTFSTSVSNGANQATILIGDTNTQASLGVAPDLVDAGLSISAAGGAACWNAGGVPADCVAWGNFTGGAALQAATGTSAGTPVSPGGITPGKAIRRKITPGCPTLLEAGDDTNNSATDFEEVNHAPRNNASAITEMACTGPTTTIDTKPANPTKETEATFTYHSTPAGATFECKLDTQAFASCPATGITYTGLSETSHTFKVQGTSVNGTGTAASYTWRVDATPPTVTIDTHPANPSPGSSAAFTFHANETVSKYECSLAKGAEADSFSACTSGKTYTSLADGEYTFKVRATDLAGNQSTPAAFPNGTYTWTVDNSLADTTPPETTIVSKPPDPSESSTASFSYESNEPGSSFECKLDGAGFASCPAAGITYTGLVEGSHTFQVRAIDPSGNVDPTPAGYSFEVVAVPSPDLNQPRVMLPPETRILAKPPARTRDRTPTFRFASSAVATFQCRLDRRPYRSCRSPFTTRALGLGRHTFAVRAVAGQLADPTPARIRFKVVRR